MTIKIRNTQQSLDHLTAIALTEPVRTEEEFFVAEHAMQLGFEVLTDHANVYACTLGQLLTLLSERLPAKSPEHALWDECCERAIGIWKMQGREEKRLAFLESDVQRIGDALRSMDHAQKWDSSGGKPLEEDAEIRAAHPLRSGNHDLYMQALHFVDARRTKYGLVALVNWLLYRIKVAEAAQSHITVYHAHTNPDRPTLVEQMSGRKPAKIVKVTTPGMSNAYEELATRCKDVPYKRFDFPGRPEANIAEWGDVNADGGLAHDLYTDKDADRPEQICDSNFQVVLGLCKVCGLAESELLDTPVCPGHKASINAIGKTWDECSRIEWSSIGDALIQARNFLQAGGTRHSWLDPHVQLAMSRSAAVPDYGFDRSGRNVKITSSGAAVDQSYPWNYDMAGCPDGKVQLLSIGGIPQYGYKAQGGSFWKAWAPLPKDNGPGAVR